MKVISIALQKGGTGKTTTALNLAADLGSRHKRVLLIDMDSQANATFASGVRITDDDNSTYNVLHTDNEYRCNITDAIVKTKYYDLVPADIYVSSLVDELNSALSLKNALNPVSNDYDYVILDTPPSLSVITVNAFVASDFIIIPSEPKPFNFTGMRDLENTLNDVKANWNPDLKILGILLVKYKKSNMIGMIKNLIEQEATALNTTCFDTVIGDRIKVCESQLMHEPLIDYAPKDKTTLEYKAFTDEVLHRLGDK